MRKKSIFTRKLFQPILFTRERRESYESIDRSDDLI